LQLSAYLRSLRYLCVSEGAALARMPAQRL